MSSILTRSRKKYTSSSVAILETRIFIQKSDGYFDLAEFSQILEEPVSLLNVLEMGDSENRSMKAAFVKWHKRLKVLLI